MKYEIGNPFPKDSVQRAANLCIAAIEKDRSESVAAEIEKKRYRRKYWMFGPLLKLTDEEARARCDHDELMYAGEEYGKQYGAAKLIAKAAENIVGPVILLTLEEFDHIASWMEA